MRPTLTLFALALASCSSIDVPFFSGISEKGQSTYPLPRRESTISFFGPGSIIVDRTSLDPVTFPTSAYNIPPDQSPAISAAAAAAAVPGTTLLIAGFADDPGSDSYNLSLADARALAVRDSLIAAGADPAHLHTAAFGNTTPATPDLTLPSNGVAFGIAR